MARRTRRPAPTAEHTLAPVTTTCVACGHHLYPDYSNFRTITTLAGVARYTLRIGRCRHATCDLYSVPFRPEAEGRIALPHHEFGLDVIAYVGNRRYAAHRTAPEIHAELTARGVSLSVRTVTNLLHRFDELRALAATDPDRMRPVFEKQGVCCWPSTGIPLTTRCVSGIGYGNGSCVPQRGEHGCYGTPFWVDSLSGVQ